MRDTGGEQADRGQLFSLCQLGFKADARGNVVDEHDAAQGAELARDQRRDGDVGEPAFFQRHGLG